MWSKPMPVCICCAKPIAGYILTVLSADVKIQHRFLSLKGGRDILQYGSSGGGTLAPGREESLHTKFTHIDANSLRCSVT